MPSDDTLQSMLSQGSDGLNSDLIGALPLAWRHRDFRPDAYDFEDESLTVAAKAALLLSQPLILAGEPGVGKSSFARALAARLGLQCLPTLSVKSTIMGADLFYTFNEVARFRDASRQEGAKGMLDYVGFSSLGRAILLSAGADTPVRFGAVPLEEIFGEGRVPDTEQTLGDLFPAVFGQDGSEPRRTLVLIDELDKAPRDAPNDVLNEIETMSFRIQELDIEIKADPAEFPVVIITSNSERSFPDPFLRRCVFHWISYPTPERLRRIAASRAAEAGVLSPNDPLVHSAVELFGELRDVAQNKVPSTAELISFVASLLQMDYQPGDKVDLRDQRVRSIIGVLLKTRIDLDAYLDHAG